MYQIAIVEDEEIYAKLLEEYIHRYEKDSLHQFKIRHYRDGAEIAEKYRGGGRIRYHPDGYPDEIHGWYDRG